MDTARFLHVHGAKAMAGLPSAQRIAAGVAASYDTILGSFRSASSRFDAATFLAPPSSSIARSDIADQWVGVTMPVDEIDLSPARLSVSANAAIFCL